MRVVVTGGTGLIGRALVPRLIQHGHEVIVISRSGKGPAGCRTVQGDPSIAGDWLREIEACDAVIHLAGESIAGGRWTRKFKQRILDSRILSTSLIARTMAQRPRQADQTPRILVSTSAIGYYGNFTDNETEFVETDLPGSGFLPDTCVQWEKATQAAVDAGVRVPIVRVGIVLDGTGGALPKMIRPFRWYLGGAIGLGKQWMSWIHLDDIARLYLHVLEHPQAQGPINGVAPESLTNWGFSQIIAKVLKRPCWLTVPPFALKLLLGEMSILATHGQRVIPMKAKELGFEFEYPLPEAAIRAALGMPNPDEDDWSP